MCEKEQKKIEDQRIVRLHAMTIDSLKDFTYIFKTLGQAKKK